jgi:hypothetical protein
MTQPLEIRNLLDKVKGPESVGNGFLERLDSRGYRAVQRQIKTERQPDSQGKAGQVVRILDCILVDNGASIEVSYDNTGQLLRIRGVAGGEEMPLRDAFHAAEWVAQVRNPALAKTLPDSNLEDIQSTLDEMLIHAVLQNNILTLGSSIVYKEGNDWLWKSIERPGQANTGLLKFPSADILVANILLHQKTDIQKKRSYAGR